MALALPQTARRYGETFWLLPAAMVALAIVLALGLVSLDKSGLVPDWVVNSPWYYSGATRARTLLGVVASSTVGVAGTVFSITIAALSLAAGRWDQGCCAISPRAAEPVHPGRLPRHLLLRTGDAAQPAHSE